MANHEDYNGLFYTNENHEDFMEELCDILYDCDIEWFCDFEDDDHDLDWDTNEDFFDDDF